MDEDANLTALSLDVRRAVGGMYRRLRSERPPGDLGDAALEVLVWLHTDGPRTLKELSERARVTPASMSQTVNRLTSSGYAERTADPGDGRRVLFRLTRTGEALARAARERRHAWLAARLAALDPDERAALERASAILQRIAES